VLPRCRDSDSSADNLKGQCRDVSAIVGPKKTMFHHDMILAEVPSKATLLYSVEIPSIGGNTLFASL